MFILKKIYWLVLALLICACSSTIYTNRTQLMLLNEQQEKALGEQSALAVLKESKLSQNTTQTAMVKRVGQKIASIANRPDFNWEFYLIENKAQNAFCLPGGKVFVYTGLMELISNDDELAVVISHEIGHTILRHGAERMSMQTLQQLGGSILEIFVGTQNPEYNNLFNKAYNVSSNVGIMLPFSRHHELEADEVGIILMQKAGYNPQAALSFWQKMSQGNKETSDFFSTHPSDTKRIQEIKRILTK
ncbi:MULTISPECIES: M48 family metallopeptidase [Helicobacter]|uniref:M48 family metallopeptidase n=1 Tax=Helicobacter TaxID=209 RepID=UPI00202A9F4D|nr:MULTISPECIES: M48 family metallopeptidase [Helicobacter]MCI7046574.1 M48 family metallopeptidase [Helicobacter sp.]MCL9822423.1 M48 family metallopeptidase [Helicobacter colisuis]